MIERKQSWRETNVRDDVDRKRENPWGCAERDTTQAAHMALQQPEPETQSSSPAWATFSNEVA
ncbi:MAG: hypothetical protein KF810_14675 [Rhizobiaceae bacterium]|nr:hypothetical protein [Rhizobiaceae bacterium]